MDIVNNINNNRYRSILSVISISKFCILLFISIVNINKSSLKVNVFNNISTNDWIVFTIPILLIIVIALWSFSYTYMYKLKRIRIVQIVEDCIFMSILFFLIISSNTYQSQYKYLYIFSIISSTISFGKKYGIIISILSSGSLLCMDLLLFSNLQINTYFENDLMLSSAFIIIAWILGEYKRFEINQRELLESELREQLKLHGHIEEMMIKNEDCYNLLINHSHLAIIIHNGNDILYINKRALQLIGINVLSEINNSILSLYDDKDLTKEYYENMIINKESNKSFEESIRNKNGSSINILNISTYCIYGKTPSLLTIIRDITPEKRVHELNKEVNENKKLLTETKEQNKFITEFFINISHELKTPLNIIFSSIQVLNMYDDYNFLKKRRKYLSVMKQNAYRLIRLINNLLDVTKYDNGYIMLNAKNGDIVKVIEDLSMSIVPYAESKGIELVFDTNIEEKIIAFDEDKIERIILNLLSNALKFTDRGGEIHITITDKDDNVEISIRDTGIGIPDDKKEIIFERFMQVDKTLKRNTEGTGIGLSLVKSFVELHNGNISIKSKIGHGSEFIITLKAMQISESICEAEIKNNIIEKVNMELSDIYSDENNNI